VVVCTQDPEGENYLTAYYTASGEEKKEIDENNLVNQLKASIPDYMVPGAFYRLDAFPLTPTGKIDRKSLSESTGSQIRSMKAYVAPSEGIETTLATMWKELLKVEKVGIYDNFFVLGGNSLKAIMLTSKLHKEQGVKLPLAEVFKSPTISELAGYLKKAAGDTFVSIEAVEKKEYYLLSSAQKRLFVQMQLDETSTAYNMPSIMKLEGICDKERIESTFIQLIKRHESLRTSFHVEEGQPVQKIENAVELKMEFYDLTPPSSPPHHLIKKFIRPFDLSRAPLLRVGLKKMGEETHILMVDMHHIISDGTSKALLVKEFMALYPGEELPVLRVQTKDYSGWQNSKKERESIKAQAEYWLNQYRHTPPGLKLPVDYTGTASQVFGLSRLSFEIEPGKVLALKNMASRQGVTMYMLLMALYNILLSKVSTQEDIVVGTPTAGRKHSDLHSIIGMFVNTLAIRNYPTGKKTFYAFLKETKERILDAFENQDFPFEELVQKLEIKRDPNRNPLFRVMFNLLSSGSDLGQIPELEIPGLALTPVDYEGGSAKFDLNLKAIEEQERVILIFEFRDPLFKKEAVEKLARYLKSIISEVLENPGKRLSEIEIVSDRHKEDLLEKFNVDLEDE